MSKVGSPRQGLGCLCLGYVWWLCVPAQPPGNLFLSSVERLEVKSYYWRSSFPKYSLSLWAQITQLEAPLIADNTEGEEGHLCHFLTDQLCSLGGSLGSRISLTAGNSRAQRHSSIRSKPRLQ